jgi:hypothetical protein
VHIGASLLKASVIGQETYPQAYFPFEGKTRLIAAGKWLPLGEEARVTFIVYTLRSCSRPFPFRALHYDVTARNASHTDGQTVRDQSRVPNVRQVARNVPDEKLVEEDSSGRLARRARQILSSLRFPDLTTKPIWKNRVLAEPFQGIERVGANGKAVQRVAVGEPGSEKRVRPVDLEVLTKLSDFPTPGFLRELVDELTELDGIKLELLTKSEHDGWTIPISTLANEDGEIDIRFFVELGENRLRERRVAVFILALGLKRANIVVIEAVPVHATLYQKPYCDVKDFDELVRSAAVNFILCSERKSESVANILQCVFGAQTAGLPTP